MYVLATVHMWTRGLFWQVTPCILIEIYRLLDEYLL
jgi:hypothetical protein